MRILLVALLLPCAMLLVEAPAALAGAPAPTADLVTSISATPARPLANGTIVYVVRVANTGTAAALAPRVQLPTPAFTRFAASSQLEGVPLACTKPAAGASGTVSCTAAQLAPGALVRIRVVVRVSKFATGRVLTATATASTSTAQASTANDTASVARRIYSPDLRTTAVTTPLNVRSGNNVALQWRVTNVGSASAQSVQATMPLPSGMVAVSASITAGTCIRGTIVRCSSASIAPGGVRTVTVVVHRFVRGTVYVRATASLFGYDVQAGNNAATIRVNIT